MGENFSRQKIRHNVIISCVNKRLTKDTVRKHNR